MLIAAIAKQIPFPQEQLLLLQVAGLILVIASAALYSRMLRRVSGSGGRVRNDLFGLPDTMLAVTMAVLFALLLVMHWILPEPGRAPGTGQSPAHAVAGFQVLYNALGLALPVAVILAFLIGRNISLPEIFGLRRVGFVHGIVLAGTLLVVLLPMFVLVTLIANEFLGGNAEQQDLIKIYQEAAKTGKSSILWQVVIAAVCIAPVTEEILFRGYFYPVFKRAIGPLPAAFGTSLFFAAIHNNALSFPGLTLLALALTLVYERTGSLLVPMLMHAWFNGVSLTYMWWVVTHNLMQ